MTAPARTLLAGALDFAGLFPPAALPLPTALAAYAGYRAGPDAWALGRFLIPAPRLAELDAASALVRRDDWPLGVIGATAHAGPRIAAVELPVASAADIELAAGIAVSTGAQVCCEVALHPATLPALLDGLAAHGLAAKVRTGGLQPGAVPPPAALAAFLAGCFERGLRWKATAGLHHARRGTYPVDDSPGGRPVLMHGFLNLLRAALALEEGAAAPDAQAELERDPWDGWQCGPAEAEVVRRRFLGWGSCSFQIPLAELRALGWL